MRPLRGRTKTKMGSFGNLHFFANWTQSFSSHRRIGNSFTFLLFRTWIFLSVYSDFVVLFLFSIFHTARSRNFLPSMDYVCVSVGYRTNWRTTSFDLIYANQHTLFFMNKKGKREIFLSSFSLLLLLFALWLTLCLGCFFLSFNFSLSFQW